MVQGGASEPLIFVHGVMGDWRSWAPQWPAFCARYRCVSYSRRYNHPAATRCRRPTTRRWSGSNDLLQLMDALGIERAKLVASSYGAFVALALALRQPQRVVALVGVEPAMLCYAEFSASGRAELQQFRQAVVEPANAAFRAGDDHLGASLMTGASTRPTRPRCAVKPCSGGCTTPEPCACWHCRATNFRCWRRRRLTPCANRCCC